MDAASGLLARARRPVAAAVRSRRRPEYTAGQMTLAATLAEPERNSPSFGAPRLPVAPLGPPRTECVPYHPAPRARGSSPSAVPQPPRSDPGFGAVATGDRSPAVSAMLEILLEPAPEWVASRDRDACRQSCEVGRHPGASDQASHCRAACTPAHRLPRRASGAGLDGC